MIDVETLSGSRIEESAVPACCNIETEKTRRKAICRQKKDCNVKVCYFRDRPKKEIERKYFR